MTSIKGLHELIDKINGWNNQSQAVLAALQSPEGRLPAWFELLSKHGDGHDELSHGNWAEGKDGKHDSQQGKKPGKGTSSSTAEKAGFGVYDGTNVTIDPKIRDGKIFNAAIGHNGDVLPGGSGFQHPAYRRATVDKLIALGLHKDRDFIAFASAFKHASLMSNSGANVFMSKTSPREKLLEQTVNMLINKWNESSNGTAGNVAMSLVQRAVFELLETPRRTGTEDDEVKQQANELYNTHRNGVIALVKAIYDITQAELARQGVDGITLYRGVPKANLAEQARYGVTVAQVVDKPLSSYTTSYQTAMDFLDGASDEIDAKNGAIIATHVPRKHIFSFPGSGLGASHEDEFVIIGHPRTVLVQAGNNTPFFNPNSPGEDDFMNYAKPKKAKKKKDFEQDLYQSFAILTKHPGHKDQKIHGNWAHDGDPGNRESKDSKGEAHVEHGGTRDWRYSSRVTVEWGKNKTQEVLSRVQAAEKVTTPLLEQAAAAFGGKMQGLDFRFKTAASLERKIHSEVAFYKKRDPDEIIDERIADALRYTAEFPADKFTEGVKNIYAKLKSAGFTELSDRRKIQFLNKDADYKGMASIWINDEGAKFELQFHTPESFHVKEHKSHPIYTKIRVLTPKDPNYDKATKQARRELIKMWAEVQTPKDIEKLSQYL